MKIESPFLNIEGVASVKLIEDAVSNIKGEVGAFVILSESEINYIQALVTEHGYVVQFQEGTLSKHFEFDIYLSRPKTIELFLAYLSKEQNWSEGHSYSKVNVRGFWAGLGYIVGYAIGWFSRAKT